VLQQKQRHAQVFRHAFDAKAQWQLENYTLLTIPKIQRIVTAKRNFHLCALAH
jgi:hypothetical protein